ncbi:hypothetical protein [Chelativorans xinjiangense]|uniref:hypothetical protein n=1 Tax=Chelativorans xinjiangense TaxID=2681485 RepID=UPI0013586D89|nr:hypothetical protein [Chelativorans xinjiangense]
MNRQRWQDWAIVIVGIWVLGFANITALTANAVLAGIILVVLSLSVLLAAVNRLRLLT